MSRTIGDIEAKLEKYGGKSNVVIATPDVFSFDLNSTQDFIFLGCKYNKKVGDGVFDSLSNKEVVNAAWTIINNAKLTQTIHKVCGKAVEQIIKASFIHKTFDNVTGVLISFKTLSQLLERPKSIILIIRS